MKKKIEDLYEEEDDQQNENDDNYNDSEELFNFERHLTLAEERDEDEQNCNEVDGQERQEHTNALEEFELLDVYVNDNQIQDFNEQLEVDSTPDSDQRKNSVSIDNVSNNLTQQSVASQVQLTKVSTAHINPKNAYIPSTPAAVQKIAKAFTTTQKTNKLSGAPSPKHSFTNLQQSEFPLTAGVQKNAKASTSAAQKAKGQSTAQSTAKRPCLTRIDWNNKIKRLNENTNNSAAVPTPVDRVEETFNAAIRDVLRNDGKPNEKPRTKFDSLGSYVADFLNDMPKDEANSKERRILSILEN